MDWLQGLERGCQPGPEEAPLGWNHAGKFIFGDCAEPSPRLLGTLQAPWEGPVAAGSPRPWTPEKQWQDQRADGALEPREGVEPGVCSVAPVHGAWCWDLWRLPWAGGSRRGAQEGLESCCGRGHGLGRCVPALYSQARSPCAADGPRAACCPPASCSGCAMLLANGQAPAHWRAAVLHLPLSHCPGFPRACPARCPCLPAVPPSLPWGDPTRRATGTSQAVLPGACGSFPSSLPPAALRMASGPALHSWGGSWPRCAAWQGGALSLACFPGPCLSDSWAQLHPDLCCLLWIHLPK